MKNLANMGSGGASVDENDDEEMSKMSFASFQAREEEIEKKKMQVKEKVELKLGRAEEETRRLAQVWEVSSRKPRTIFFSFFIASTPFCSKE